MAGPPKTVLLHGRDSHRDDGVVGAATTPGELLDVSGGERDELEYSPHGTAAGVAQPVFALEYSHTGMSIDHDYTAGDHMEVRKCVSGDQIYAFLADGDNVVPETDYLVSDGAGALTALDTVGGDEVGSVVARPLEAVDNSAGGAPVRIRVEVV